MEKGGEEGRDNIYIYIYWVEEEESGEGGHRVIILWRLLYIAYDV